MYEQNIDISFSKRDTTLLRITNSEEVPKRCCCRFDPAGYANLTVYTVSAGESYMIAEGHSDHTVFMLLKITGKDGDMYVTEYINDATNPMDEMYSRLFSVCWYEEHGFCKLKFFNMDMVPSAQDSIRRIYFKPQTV